MDDVQSPARKQLRAVGEPSPNLKHGRGRSHRRVIDRHAEPDSNSAPDPCDREADQQLEHTDGNGDEGGRSPRSTRWRFGEMMKRLAEEERAAGHEPR
jgi:hypothetical protein